MQIDKFKVEEWFNKYEKDAKYDLADTCVDSLSIDSLKFENTLNSTVNSEYSEKEVLSLAEERQKLSLKIRTIMDDHESIYSPIQ